MHDLSETAYPLQITVNPPKIDGDTVLFSWQQCELNPFQRRNEFACRYPGLDLADFDRAIFDEILLALQLYVWRQYKRPVEVRWPHSVSHSSVEFWRRFNAAGQVRVSPTWQRPPGDLVRRQRHPSRIEALVFFGGGKDSLLAASLLGELLGSDDVLLVNEVAPVTKSEQVISEVREKLMLGPARDRLGFQTRQTFSSFLGNFDPSWRATLQPHYQQYTAGALPLMAALRPAYATLSMTWTAYYLEERTGQKTRYNDLRSRPEMLAAISQHYRRSFGLDTQLINLNLLCYESLAFKVLADRYPAAFDQMVTCPAQPASRFCHQCWKCFRFAMTSLAVGRPDHAFDYNLAIRRCEAFHQIIALAVSGAELCENGNAPFLQAIAPGPYFAEFCRQFWMIDPDNPGVNLDRECRQTLHIATALFGNNRHPEAHILPQDVIPHIPAELRIRLLDILRNYVDVGEPAVINHPDGRPVRYRYDFTNAPPHSLIQRESSLKSHPAALP